MMGSSLGILGEFWSHWFSVLDFKSYVHLSNCKQDFTYKNRLYNLQLRPHHSWRKRTTLPLP